LDPIILEPQQDAKACLVWMHGLGADAQDMVGAAQQLHFSTPVRQVFMNAPMRPVTLNQGMHMSAWYDIKGTSLTDREDAEGIKASAQSIEAVIQDQVQQGLETKNIFLVGFSQGGAMALYTGLCHAEALGGIVALSAYLPLAQEIQPVQCHSTPLFIAGGRFDPIVQPQWTNASEQWLRSKGYQTLFSQRYPMEHSICMEEIQDLQAWLSPLINRSTQP
jgi:phospholipase/carboxylesterase